MKNKLTCKIKKGFGAIEVILLLAVVAILSTLVVITVDQIKKKPVVITETNTVYTKDDPDYLTIDAINEKLTNTSFSSVHDTLKYLETKGYAIDKLTPQNSTYEFVYVKSSNAFAILTNQQIAYPSSLQAISLDPNIWRFTSKYLSKPENYSYYLLDDFEGAFISNGGVDVGNNEDVTSISIVNSTYSGELLVHTNNVSNTLYINVANASIKHLGIAGQVTVQQLPYDCFYEYGRTIYMVAQKGKIVSKNEGYIDLIYVSRNAVSVKEDGGHIEAAYCVSSSEQEIEVTGYNNFSESLGGNVYIDYINPTTLANFTAEEIRLIGSELVKREASSYSYEGVLVTGDNLTQILTFENFAKKVNEGNSYSGCIVSLLGDIDLKNASNWSPISGFAGTFDGRNFCIRNLTISSNRTSMGVGLFTNCDEGASFKNLNLKGIKITAPKANSHVGALIGQVATGITIENCSVDSTSTLVGGNVGGLVGTVIQYGQGFELTMSGCDVSATMIGNNVGGLVGRLQNYSTVMGNINATTLIENSLFDGKISGNSGKIANLGGFIGQEVNGDNLSKLVILNSRSNGTIKGSDNIISPLVAISTYRMHLNDVYINNELLTNPTQLGGAIESDSLMVSINNSLYWTEFEEEDLNYLPSDLTEDLAILVSDDLVSFTKQGEKESDIWFEVKNLNLNEKYEFSYRVDKNISYIGFNPVKFIDAETSKIQQTRYVAGHDNVNDCDIYKFDMYRIVELEQESEDGWMDNLELGEGVYFDDPTQYVNAELYDITTYELKEPEEDSEEEEQLRVQLYFEEQNNDSEDEESEEVVIIVYKVTLKQE